MLQGNKDNHINKEGRGIALPMFFCLYIAQSIPSSFFATALQVMMREAHYSLATIVVYTSAMECVRKGREGTDFTIQTVLTHLSGIIMAAVSGSMADHFGYHGLFLTECLIAVMSLLYIMTVFRKKNAA